MTARAALLADWVGVRLVARRDAGAPARDASGASWACALLRGLALDGRHFQPSGLPPTEVKLDPRAQSLPLWPRDARFVERQIQPSASSVAHSRTCQLIPLAWMPQVSSFSDVMQRSGRRHRFFDAMACRCLRLRAADAATASRARQGTCNLPPRSLLRGAREQLAGARAPGTAQASGSSRRRLQLLVVARQLATRQLATHAAGRPAALASSSGSMAAHADGTSCTAARGAGGRCRITVARVLAARLLRCLRPRFA